MPRPALLYEVCDLGNAILTLIMMLSLKTIENPFKLAYIRKNILEGQYGGKLRCNVDSGKARAMMSLI